MADDDMAVLLQAAVAELQASRIQSEAIVRQNQKLVEQNKELMDKVKGIVESSRRRCRSFKPTIVVSVYTKVYHFFACRGKGNYCNYGVLQYIAVVVLSEQCIKL